MRKHELKTWPSFFEALYRGEKTFEVRKNDRDFAVGDVLYLREWDPGKETPRGLEEWCYSGRTLLFEVTYILHGGRFGIEASVCVMGLRKIAPEKPLSST